MADAEELAVQYRKHAKALRAAAMFDTEPKTRALDGTDQTNTENSKRF